MPIETNLNVSPYHMDFDETKDYYKYLFKPGKPVQTRELNGLQFMLQHQIEKFADNVFQNGTIISGCNFIFYKPYPYIKLLDVDADGEVVEPSLYDGSTIEDSITGLKAFVVDYADGYEISDPNFKTLYIKYINSGTNGTVNTFSVGNTVTVFDSNKGITSVSIANGAVGFTNSDYIVVTSALLVNVSTGSFSNGDYLTNLEGANVEILEVNDSYVPGKSLLKIKPLATDLNNSSINSVAWTFDLYETVTDASNTVSAVVEKIYGSGATGYIITNGVGKANSVVITNKGKDYEVLPTVTIKTQNSSANSAAANLVARNYLSRPIIPNIASAVGNGYAFGVTEGIIYDAGHFLRVEDQTILVSKYSVSPNNVVVGFSVKESIVDSNIDTSLLDNSLGTRNTTAPGADRLKMVPELVLLDKEVADANTEFFSLVEWNSGYPYQQNKMTQYSALGDAMAQLVYDQSGNFVLDAFQVTTESTENTAFESTYYTAVIDPGQAYINGRKVQTLSNYKINLNKGLDTKIANNNLSLNYGNYIKVNEMAGTFDISTGSNVEFYSLPTQYLSNSSNYGTGTITPLGQQIGTAKIRSVEYDRGTPGQADCSYKLYLFDIQMNAGQNFRNIRSVYANSTYDSIADVVTEFDATLSANVAVLKETSQNQLLFKSGVESLKNSNNTNYVYRTTSVVNTNVSNGTVIISVSAGSEYFPYGSNRDLSASELRDFVVVPVEADLLQSNNLAGTVNVNTTSNTVVGSGTNFFSAFEVGDYIYATDGSFESVRRITAINSSASLSVDASFSFANTSATFRRVFPKNVPIPFGNRDGLTANVDAAEQTVVLDFNHSNGAAIAFTYGNSAIETRVSYDVQRRNTSSATKTSNRNKYIKINLANNAGGTSGPWCVGVPDAFRLRAVYYGNSSVSEASPDVTQDFYLDHNQNQNYLGLGYLYRQPSATVSLDENNYLLVCFDYFTRDDVGYFDTKSYLRTANATTIATLDSSTFDDLSNSTAACSWEVPEVYTYDNKYYDLLNQIDFRPACDATATPASNASSAPINPVETITFTTTVKFPKPNGIMSTQIEQYLGRIDDVYIGESGNIYVLKGIPDVNPRRRLQSNHPKDSLRLQLLNVPPYPNITKSVRGLMDLVLNTKTANEKSSGMRLKTKVIEPILTTTNLQTSQPMVYTMEDIANLERRIKDLEYYVSLSLLETNITNKIIPSSIDASLNRFKFGFFADDFSTEIYADLNNPQYSAAFESEGDLGFGFAGNPLEENRSEYDKTNPNSSSILQPTKLIQKETNRITPPKYIWSMKHFGENVYYIDWPILEQKNASQFTHPCIIQDNDDITTDFAYLTSVNRNKTFFYSEGLSGVTTLYFQIYGIRGANIAVYAPNNSLIAHTNSADNLNDTDKLFITTNQFANSYYSAINKNGYDRVLMTGLTTNTVVGSGKLTFNTSESGRYRVIVNTLAFADNQKILVKYPAIAAADDNILTDPACNPKQNPKYIGSLGAGSLTIQQWSCSNQFRVNSTNYKAFVITATGLKPNTVHRLYLDSEQWPHVLNLTQSLFAEAHYEPRRAKAEFQAPAYMEALAVSAWKKVNEVARFFQLSRAKLYNSNGTPTGYTVLRSNAQGQLRALVFFPLSVAGWFSQDFNAFAYSENPTSATSVFKIGKVTTTSYYEATQYYNKIKPTYGSSGYTTIQLSNGVDSQAIRVFANRTPNKIIPRDPKGSI